MDFENEESDHLKFQHLAGGNIVDYPPLYAPSGEHLMFLCNKDVNVYSTITGQIVRKLEGSTEDLIDFEFELQYDDILVACNASGEIFSWVWKTGELKNTIRIPSIKEGSVTTVTNFKLLKLYGKSDLPYAFVCSKIIGGPVQFRVVDRVDGKFIKVPCDIHLTRKNPLVAVDNKNFPNIALVQGFNVFLIDYKKWTWNRYLNAHQVPITALQLHSSEECLATGDEIGRIFLWREFSDKSTLKTSLYHWHHTKVTSICFTATGSNFYSSGEEAVLVKWNVENPELRQYLPRMVQKICHVVVSPLNTDVAVCTVDNSVHIIGVDKKIYQNLQEFTYIADDKVKTCKFPVGLRLNPRNNSLVLNGRTGSLQFFNTYTKRLLYNVNIVNQNVLSTERDRILYDTRVTKAAFNIDWMATGEVFNDEEYLPELRLKFWKYVEESQNYTLNTNIEFPHEGGFKAIEFSNDYQVNNLLCATVGEDNIIKIWSLEDSDNIYTKGKTWYCIAQTSYKNLPVESISFSQDGSVLAAGYGNILCIYKSDNLRLKAALNGSNGIDGCVNKAQIKVSPKSINGTKSDLAEKVDRIMQLFTSLLETNEETLIKELQMALNGRKSIENGNLKSPEKLDDEQKTRLYKKILQMHELNLFQKVLLYQKLGIACKVHPQMETKLLHYLHGTLKQKVIEDSLNSQMHRLNLKQRFKAKYRLEQYCKRQRQYDDKITRKLVPVLSLLNLDKLTKPKQQKNNVKSYCKSILSIASNDQKVLPPTPAMAQISHVQFAAGEYAHLVVVCTERRILIWNLLTLRLQAVLKLTVKYLSFDRQTNLMAVVTQNNELHVFQPNVPLPIYQRRNLPSLYGIAWIPRRYPKQRSIHLDWQAQSTLYFLTENQKIYFLSSPNEKQPDVPAPIVFDNVATDSVHYSTFGTYAMKAVLKKQLPSGQVGPLVLGNSDKTAVRALIDMSVHTMPSMSLICEDFVKSMVKPIDYKPFSDVTAGTSTEDDNTFTTRLNGKLNGFGSHSDDEDADEADGDVKMTNGRSSKPIAMKIRKDLINKTEELKRKQKSVGINGSDQPPPFVHDAEENRLRCLAQQEINIDF